MTFAKETQMKTLIEMLTYRRPAGSKTERKFIRKFIAPLGMQRDKYGNLYKRIGDAPVLWSCHTDTVHRQGGMQSVNIQNDWVSLPIKTDSTCLGADDTTGVWLMCEMIRAEHPGLYVFHRAEECGGCGSSYIEKHTPELLNGINYAIALDRMGADSVITHQCYRTCSDAFANALALKLGGQFTPDSGGVFTDTANYIDLIPECTNLSVGYYNQHTKLERQDLQFAAELRDKLLTLDVTGLPVARCVTDKTDYGWGKTYGHYYSDDNDALGSPYGERGSTTAWNDNRTTTADYGPYTAMSDIIADHPKEVADILRSYGLSSVDLIEELRALGVSI